MKGSGRPWTAALVILTIAGMALLAAWRLRPRASASRPPAKQSAEPAPALTTAPIPVTPAPRVVERPPRARPVPEPEPIEEPPPPPRARQRSLAHDVDPCRPVVEPPIPSGHDGLTAQGITLAWPLDGPAFPEPTAFAYLVAGLLEEAAQLTGTTRREHLTVIFYPSREELAALGGAPKWASGFYDGAVKLPIDAGKDFGVQLPSLRHELMHAQLHTGAGCSPLWFNEGTAMYFSGRPPRRTWTRMLRSRKLLDFAAISASTLDELDTEDVDLVYGESLAMVLYTMDHGGDTPLVRAVDALRAAPRGEARAAARDLWRRLHPGADPRALLDSLARRMFQLPLGPALDEQLRAAICCSGTTRISELACRGGPLDPTRAVWLDESRTPIATCTRE